ncbi:hypothetical protein M4I32_04460 [Microbacterium sp. LRZ72]|uniref:phosphotransferase n=1 Tax=Microbacterium sp. LRZ72 TaxID=2942481 RepID=UPI0029A8B563|nr:phosphotransferase [Microbacterium sp. LRZ72]MDX2376049.1 hypothetical protein [Microbacterium sp. LRZ72]
MTRTGESTTAGGIEAALLGEALDVDARVLRLISREPLGRGSVTGFEVAATGETGADAATTTWFVDTSGSSVRTETGMVSPDGERVWQHPADPYLPALAPAAFGGAAEVLLARLGLHAQEPPRMVGYRPGRRAVLRAPTATGAVWVKVVRPSRIDSVIRAHEAFAAAGIPVPPVLGWSPEGLLVLGEAAGIPATDVVWDPDALLAEVERLRRSIAMVTQPAPARTGLVDRLEWYRGRVAAGGADAAATDLIDRITPAALTPSRAGHTIHGDLHLGQLFLDGQGTDVRVVGLIDVDTAGRGDRRDDDAAFASHAIASALLTEGWGDAPRAWALAGSAVAAYAGPGVPERIAVHLLGHAIAASELGHADRSVRLTRAGHAVMDGSFPAAGMPAPAREDECKNGLMTHLAAP